jgi:hypothetical protein
MPLVATLMVPMRRNALGEYHCRARYADGTRCPDADYFTDDRDDAEVTARAVAAAYRDSEEY